MPVLHDATTGTTLPIEWNIHGEMDRSLDVSPDGRWIAAGGSRDAILLSADGHRSILLPHSNHVHLAMFAPDNRSLATLGYEAIVRCFHFATSTLRMQACLEIMPQHGTFANGAFSPDSHALAVASNQQIVIWERKSAATVTGQNLVESRCSATTPELRWSVRDTGCVSRVLWGVPVESD